MVYVSPIYKALMSKRWHWSKHCYLLADTVDELHSFAKRLKLKHSWYQPTSSSHYDLTASKRSLALVLGAEEIDTKELVLLIKKQRSNSK